MCDKVYDCKDGSDEPLNECGKTMSLCFTSHTLMYTCHTRQAHRDASVKAVMRLCVTGQHQLMIIHVVIPLYKRSFI